MAERKFKEVSEAYKALQNVAPINLNENPTPPPPPRSSQTPKRKKETPPSHKPEDKKADPPPIQDVFGDIWGNLFKGGDKKEKTRFKGNDLKYHLSINSEEAEKGTEKIIHFVRKRGLREDTAKLSVKIPAGVKEGQKLKLSGEGDAAIGTDPGDLYVILVVEENIPSIYSIDGNNLHLDLPISFVEACLGGEVIVPTLTGKTALTIPLGTSSHQKMKLKGKGIKDRKTGKTGDLYVHIQVDVPKEISPSQRQKLESLKIDETLYKMKTQFEEKIKKGSK